MRPHGGATRGQLDWRRPTRMTLHTVRHHPIAAGAYRWGDRQLDPRTPPPGRRRTGRTVHAPDDCEVLSTERFPATISGERFDASPHRCAHTRATAEALGAPREGPSLGGGLWVCGRCGRRLIPASSGRANRLRDSGSRGVRDDGAPRCLRRSGAFLDRVVVAQIRHVLQPAA
jgi:hypothetical protein